MQPEPGIKWLFLDLNSYFASVEQQEDPSLRGRPVAVVPAATDTTCAIAASKEAKACGIRTGTPVYEAKKLCPSLRCVVARHDRYVAYHHRIVEETARHVPINRIWSIDELSSRLPPRLRSRAEAVAVAERIRQGIRNNIGECIGCSIGLAPNSFLAKTATDMQKPDGLVVLEPQDMRARLCALKLTDLPGINVRMEERLRRAGIRTVAQLWAIAPKHARAVWGSVGGERFWYNLHGYDLPDLPTRTCMVGHSRVLEPALRPPDQTRLTARRLMVKAARRLRRGEFHATRLSLSLRTVGGLRADMEMRLPPTRDDIAFLAALDTLWDRALATLPRPGLAFRKVAVILDGLQRTGDITLDLFEYAAKNRSPARRGNEALTRALDTLNRRYGAQTVHIGPPPQARSGYAETKIAFSRIPDRAEFDE